MLYTAQEIIPILIDHLAQHSSYRGAVIKSISSSDLVARVAAHHGLAVIETPIGFKYIGDRMLAGEAVLLGGEESGESAMAIIFLSEMPYSQHCTYYKP